MATEKKCKISQVLEEAGYVPHEIIEGFNVWKVKNLFAVWHPNNDGNNGGVQLLYTKDQYSPEICREDILSKLIK